LQRSVLKEQLKLRLERLAASQAWKLLVRENRQWGWLLGRLLRHWRQGAWLLQCRRRPCGLM
jgi:hypothetical protein